MNINISLIFLFTCMQLYARLANCCVVDVCTMHKAEQARGRVQQENLNNNGVSHLIRKCQIWNIQTEYAVRMTHICQNSEY